MGAIIHHGGIRSFSGLHSLLILTAIMWVPGLVSLAVRYWTGTGYGDVGLALGRRRYWLLAIGIPLILCLSSSIICDLLDIRNFGLPEQAVLHGRIKTGILVLVLGLLGAIGEELGWRGFLLPKLYVTRIRFPVLVSGVIWALWHLPLIMYGGYYRTDSPVLMGALYLLSILAISVVIGWLRMRSGSVWTASLMHAVHNFSFQFLFPAIFFAIPGSRIGMFETVAADTGIIPTLLYGIAVIFLLKPQEKCP
ncbi:MAG: CPBP family intramembrane metalloprotease [Oligoflexia bacterium]|nr:CPBP family intramembrane metalloprotease [Oligoflexia bacterium]